MTPPPDLPGTLTRRQLAGMWFGGVFFWPRGRRKLAGIEFRVIRGKRSGRRFLRIHGSEPTAAEVLELHMKRARGTAFIIASQVRNVTWKGGLLDPNRMFSHEGAERNLRSLNSGWNEAQLISALMVLDARRHQLVDAVRPHGGEVLIAMHNNGPGYSVRDEIDGSDRWALNDQANPHEFCLCTSPADFEVLSRGSYNVVLQYRKPLATAPDDGSLSRLAAVEGFRYVNIEAGLGKKDKQSAMLEWVDGVLK